MVLCRNVELDETTCWNKIDNSGFLTFGVITLCFICIGGGGGHIVFGKDPIGVGVIILVHSVT